MNIERTVDEIIDELKECLHARADAMNLKETKNLLVRIIKKHTKAKHGKIYEFYWGTLGDYESFLLKINMPKEKVKELLDEYREQDPDSYNNMDWARFLENKGVLVEGVEPEHQIYF